MATGVTVLFGWAFGIDALRTWGLGSAAMKANAALAFVLAGTALFVSLLNRRTQRVRVAGWACAGGAALIGVLTLGEYALGRKFGIDQALFRDPVGTSFAGRISVGTAVDFVMLGVAICLLDARSRAGTRVSQGLALVAFAVAMFVTLGHLYGATALTELVGTVPMAASTAVALLALAAGVICAMPRTGLPAELVSPRPGGLLMRRIVPALLVVVPFLFLLRLKAEEAGLIGTETGVGLMTMATVVLLGGLAWSTARSINGATREHDAYQEHVREEALRDSLTGLGNRPLFMDRLRHAGEVSASQPAGGMAILMLDIDRFKLVNDSHGHPAGDRLLVEVAKRLTTSLPADWTIARLGGDEFAVLVETGDGEYSASRAARAVLACFALPFRIEHQRHLVSASVGIVVAGPGALDCHAIMRDADAATYRAKERGGDRYELFDPTLHTRAVRRMSLENEVRNALARDQFRLHYQPIVQLAGGSLEAVEALVRWEHPERGLVPPDEFIPVAEELGLIGELGAWVLKEACRQGARWSETRAVTMNVNLSGHQFAGSSLVPLVSRTLHETGLDPKHLGLEITETVLLEHGEAPAATLERLHDLGVRIVLDDFGTGYSSLSYLAGFSIDELKIDRSFIDGLGGEAPTDPLAAAILALAEELDIEVVAEGIETEEQLAWLRDRDCALGQGYHFSRPLPSAEFERQWIRAPELVSSR